jgi:hypothetical protein
MLVPVPGVPVLYRREEGKRKGKGLLKYGYLKKSHPQFIDLIWILINQGEIKHN